MAYLGKDIQYGHLRGQTETGDGNTQKYTLDYTVNDAHALEAYIGNVHQEPDQGYTITDGGTSITFTSNVPNGERVYIRYLGIQYDTPVVYDNSITSAKIALNQVTSSEIANNSVNSVHIAANAITAEELATNAIATLYLADNSVTSVKIAENNITAREIDSTATPTFGDVTLTSTNAGANVGPILKLYRNSSSPADDDALGRIQWTGEDDAGNESTFARINVVATDVSNGSEDARMEFAPAVGDSFTPTMSLTTGRVGIGTTSPTEMLTVKGDGADILIVDAGDGEMAKLGATGSNNGLLELKNSSHAAKVFLNTSGDSYLNGGNVGIGTTSPSSVLSVKSDVNNNVNNGILFEAADSTNKLLRLYENSTGECYMGFYQADTQTALIRTNGNSYFNGGNVGIGTSSPSRLLDIENSTAGGSTLVSLVSATDGNVQLLMGDTASDTQGKILYNNDGDYMGIYSNDEERMRIASDGKVSIGTTTTDRELKVQKTSDHSIIAAVSGTSNLAGIVMGDTSDDDRGAVLYNNNGDYMYFQTDTAERMRIDSSGNIGFGTTTLPAGMASSSYKQFKIGGGILADSGHSGGHNILLGNNVYVGSGNDLKFTHGAAASAINMTSGDINFRTHDGGGASADATATLNSRLYIKENGQVGIGNQTSPSYRLDVKADGSASAFRVASSTDGQDLNCAIQNSGTSSGDDALLAISTTNGAGDPYIRMSIAGTEDWHIGVDNSDSDTLHIGRNSSIGSGTKMVLGNDIAMKAGGATGQTHLKFNNSQASVADDALIDISGVVNTGCLVAISSRYKGASIVYCQALYYVDYRSSTAPILLADPSDAFSNGDVDGKNCLFMNGNANLRYKNRNGITNYVAITIIQFQGN